jgi:predicted nucleotidyltransferase
MWPAMKASRLDPIDALRYEWGSLVVQDITTPSLLEIVRGFKRFNDWELAEREAELPRLIVSDSLTQFFALCDSLRSWRPDPMTDGAFIELDESGWIEVKRRLGRDLWDCKSAMQAQLAAVREVSQFLASSGIKHFVIGGIANAVWGRPRATQDADFKVLVGALSISEFVALVAERFRFRIPDAVSFAQRTYVLPLFATNGTAVDISLGFLPYEEQAMDRGVPVVHDEVRFVVCTAEDLIIQKAVSERQKDWDDIEGVLIRQGQGLDQKYILKWLQQFAEILERPELVQRYRDLQRGWQPDTATGTF